MQTKPKPFVFVLMPFSRDFDDTYSLAIRPACEAAGAYAERVDEQIFQGSILERVFNQISKADIVVADMSNRNPNVFYEVGYAHALGKRTLLVTRNADDIPFDLKHYPHIIYGDRLLDLKNELERRVLWNIEHPGESKRELTNLYVRINGRLINEKCDIALALRAGEIGFTLRLDFQNRIGRSIDVATFQVGLFAPAELSGAGTLDGYQTNSIKIEDGRCLHLCDKPFAILPEAWDSLNLFLKLETGVVHAGDQFEFCLRIYRDSGVMDLPFSVSIVAK